MFRIGLLALICVTAASAEDGRSADPMKFAGMSNAPFNGNRKAEASNAGHLVYLKVGDVEMTADLAAKNPLGGGDEKVVGAITEFNWSGLKSDRMELTVAISKNNYSRIQSSVGRGKIAGSKVNFQLFALGDTAQADRLLLKSFTSSVPGPLTMISWSLPENRPKSTPIRGALELSAGSGSVLDFKTSELKLRLTPPGGPFGQLLVGESQPNSPFRLTWGP